MAYTRISAIRRLVNLYIEQLVANADYHLQVGIGDVLTEDNILAVQSLNLHPDMDHQPAFEAVVQFDDRDMQLLAARLSSPPRAFGRVH
jgi:hypothetical protein